MVNYPTILNLPQKDINRQLYERVLKLQVKAKYHVLSLTVNDGANAISGATVVIGEESETTGADGKATFTLPYDDYSVSISATGFESATETLQFRSNHKSFTVSLTATGGDTGTVTVTCQHEVDGQMSHTFDEFDGVKLSTHSTYDWDDEMGEAQYLVANGGTLDENGTVTLLVEESSTDVPFGSYYLYAQGYLSASQELLQYSGTLTVDGDEEVTITLTAVDNSDHGGLIG